jgi:hypothetical protein
MLIFDRRFYLKLVAEIACLLQCGAAANTGKMQREQVSQHP